MSHVDPEKVKLFEDNFIKLGDTPQAVHWGSESSAAIRYQSILDTIGDLSGLDVLDIGCGLGHLYEYTRLRGQLPLSWTGIEMEKSFVQAMKLKFRGDSRFHIVEGQFVDIDPGVVAGSGMSGDSLHFHLAVLVGTISLVDPKDFSTWLTRLERDWDVDCFMIEFLRKGISDGPFHKYDLQDMKTLFAEKDYETKFVFHELPHVFNVYAWPHKLKREFRPRWEATNITPQQLELPTK